MDSMHRALAEGLQDPWGQTVGVSQGSGLPQGPVDRLAHGSIRFWSF